MDKLIEIIGRAYELGMQAQNGECDQGLAEELTSECAEFLAVWDEDFGAFESMEIIDKQIMQLVNILKGLNND
jgi:hypothetical protein